MIRPQRSPFMPGTKVRDIENGPVRLTSRISCHSSRDISSIGLRLLMPALLIRMSQTPKASLTIWSTSAAAVSSVTSAMMYSAVPPRARIPWTTSESNSSFRATKATFAPAPARASAISRPRPLLAPVTTATWFSNETVLMFKPAREPRSGSKTPRISGQPQAAFV